ncbi:MAG: cytochrome b/b6 domain-containing protein [Chloroflexi bacterium]|nr:cytochrome b/b6 domain-containing protein [Chloroflexota bacterium]
MTVIGPGQTETKKREQDYFVRFNTGQRLEHIVLMVSFIVLSVTGLAQRYSTADWGQFVIFNLGGIEYTRLIHRGFGILFTLSIVYHLTYASYAVFGRHARPSMVPTLKDARDVVASLRYGFGFSDRPPQFGRFDYRQKFEYWGMIFGSMVIIVTGFILMYPYVITAVLSGQFVAAAREFHGYEATLAVLTIVVWHFYEVIFRPGIFPGDLTIFTGKISRKRMLEEHPMEYAELAESGKAGPAPAGAEPAGE